MGPAHPEAVVQAFSGAYSRALLTQLRDVAGAEAVTEVLGTAGETRPPARLIDRTTWNSYPQFRALMEASSRFLDAGQLRAAGRRLVEMDRPGAHLMTQNGDSPDWVLERLPRAVTLYCPILQVRSEQVDQNEWLITQTFAHGLEAFAEFCALQAGGHSLITTIYGLPAAEIEEEQCATHGAAACVMRLRWPRTEGLEARVRLLQAQVGGLETWLSEFEQTVSGVLSSRDLSHALKQAFASIHHSMHGSGCVLALRDLPIPQGGQILGSGVDPTLADTIGRRLLTGDADGSTEQVCEVLSPRRSYGWIAVQRATGDFQPEEARRLKLYAGLIAAALDCEFAIAEAQRQEHEAHRQEQGARALLELSMALHQVTTVEEVPQKLVQAVPGVMGLHHAAVLTPASDRSHATVRATYGYPPDADELLRAQTYRIPRAQPGNAFLIGPGELGLGPLTGAGGAMVAPITVNDEWMGSLVAPIDEARAATGLGRDDRDRLQGMAAQASTAITNAMLLGQVRHQALHDSLTGLPNRALILDRVEQLLVSRGPGARRTPAVLFIDLDGFKEVNDTFGHAAGDQLLLTFARRLRLAVRAQDTVGRLGGDEFVVLLEDAESVLPQEVAERLLAAARDPFTIDEVTTGELSVTASIGIATGEREEAGQLLRDADVALYNAKAAGKNRFAMFRAQMQLSVHDRVLLQMEVQEAVELGQFSLVLQPRRDLASNRTVAVQAWPRWQHPQRGVLDAEEFGPLVQDGTVAIHIGRWLLSHACDQVTRWHQDGIDLDLAIAVASAHLHDESFLDDVHQTLAASGLKPEQLVVEISERAMLGEQTMIAARLGVLHDLGIRISVNGFGIAAFPLASLSSLPIGLLKIEKIFLQDPGAGERPPDLARPLIHLAKALGLMAIADGIAHPAQRDRLRLEGCTYGQGPLFGARMDPRSLEALVRQESARQPQVPGQPQKPGQPR